ncbi:2OG-Fe(II) oxygenase [Metapseudomonas lalkuanensis]|uniref:2OG-Fe(II) oxygenase n=1 Tax=Metapseudomonas lalkuanensis TaxID=2604832 RepID=UPI001CF5124D|nr:2OG-Fe(II) oxygenase [Pseudomonas lalkuanensis]UCO98511.1 2OG-Fe(II) oxygenase [Pseudomonas lalkuanensis]
MTASPESPLTALIVDDLANQGWSHQCLALPAELTAKLAEECRVRSADGSLAPASVGRGEGQQVREGVRGDRIHWLEPGQSAASDAYLALMDDLRQRLNLELYLGLEDFECHFALYPPGAFYQKHLDRFRDDDRRTVSVVAYLNADWQAEQGGALRLYLAEGERDVLPEGGGLVVFLSAELPHEVLPATRERMSIAGWFRRRGGPL